MSVEHERSAGDLIDIGERSAGQVGQLSTTDAAAGQDGVKRRAGQFRGRCRTAKIVNQWVCTSSLLKKG